MALASAAAAAALATSACDGCRGGGPETTASRETASQPPVVAEAGPAASTAASAARALPPPDLDAAPPPPCRFVGSEGRRPGVDPTAWLTLGDRESVTVRLTETARELRFSGPGKVRPCGGDASVLAEGGAAGLPGGGEAPGSEHWVATPCAAVRWTIGVQRITASANECNLHTSLGSSFVWVAEDVTAARPADAGAPSDGGGYGLGSSDGTTVGEDGWRRVDAHHGLAMRPRAKLGALAWARAALDACGRAAAAASELAARLGEVTGRGEPMGDLAARHVSARRAARAACGVATARVALAGSPREEEARLARQEALLRGEPEAGAPHGR